MMAGRAGAVPRDIAGRIEEFRKRLGEATQFAELWQHFDAELLTDDAFIELGARADHSKLRSAVEGAVARILPSAGALCQLELLCVAPHGLFHGFASFERALCTCMYFEADDRGLLVIKRNLFDAETHYARFMMFETWGGAFPVPGARGSVQ